MKIVKLLMVGSVFMLGLPCHILAILSTNNVAVDSGWQEKRSECLTTAEAELEEAAQKYKKLRSELLEMRKTVAIAQAKMKATEEAANALERQEDTARSSKDRAEGQYNSTKYDSGARNRDNKEVRDGATRLTRGTTTKAGEARAVAEKEKIKVGLLEKEMNEIEAQLRVAAQNLKRATDNLDKIKDEQFNTVDGTQNINPNHSVSGPKMTWVYIVDAGVSEQDSFVGYMSKYPTTNAQFAQYLNDALNSGNIAVDGNFIKGTSGPHKGQNFYQLDGQGKNYNKAKKGGTSRIKYIDGTFTVERGFDDHPVTFVSWYGAVAFADYYGWRLPTEWEWQAVADYDGSYIYACGLKINNTKANYYGSHHPEGTTSVGQFGTYGYDIADMTGNVWEWTNSLLSPDSSQFIVRGGGWGSRGHHCTVSNRTNYAFPYLTHFYYGFRVCR